MRKVILSVVFALLLPPALFANHYADFYVIPIAGHVNGLNGTMWMSDVAIQNFQAVPITVEIFFIEQGEGRTDNVFPIAGANGSMTIAAGGSVIVRDILNQFNAENMALGALLVGSDRPFAVTSRSYSMSPSGDTVGQTVLPVRDFLENTIGDTNNAMAVAYIPGAVQNSRFRTNVGFVAGSGASNMGVEITVKNSDGSQIGKRTFTVPANTFSQVQVPITAITTTSTDAAGIEVRIASGDGAVAPYASVIDNSTADAVYVAGTMPPNTLFAKTTPDIFRRLFDRIRQ